MGENFGFAKLKVQGGTYRSRRYGDMQNLCLLLSIRDYFELLPNPAFNFEDFLREMKECIDQYGQTVVGQDFINFEHLGDRACIDIILKRRRIKINIFTPFVKAGDSPYGTVFMYNKRAYQTYGDVENPEFTINIYSHGGHFELMLNMETNEPLIIDLPPRVYNPDEFLYGDVDAQIKNSVISPSKEGDIESRKKELSVDNILREIASFNEEKRKIEKERDIVEEENKLYTGILSQLQSDYLETIKLGDKYKEILEKMRRQMDSLNKKLSDIHKQIKIYETTLEKINKHIDKLTDELHKNIHGGNKIIYFKLSNVLL